MECVPRPPPRESRRGVDGSYFRESVTADRSRSIAALRGEMTARHREERQRAALRDDEASDRKDLFWALVARLSSFGQQRCFSGEGPAAGQKAAALPPFLLLSTARKLAAEEAHCRQKLAAAAAARREVVRTVQGIDRDLIRLAGSTEALRRAVVEAEETRQRLGLDLAAIRSVEAAEEHAAWSAARGDFVRGFRSPALEAEEGAGRPLILAEESDRHSGLVAEFTESQSVLVLAQCDASALRLREDEARCFVVLTERLSLDSDLCRYRLAASARELSVRNAEDTARSRLDRLRGLWLSVCSSSAVVPPPAHDAEAIEELAAEGFSFAL
ncbi:hypothetical protein DIPPA_30632 [Diplonema papillatum]|nr:hypothetical protein DIPPA_30632 [Diplonema papillatum]